MNIALDLDGVLYKWSPTARYLLNTHRGTTYHREPSAWEWIENAEDDEWLWTEGIRKGLFRYGALYKGAVTVVDRLWEARHGLCVITHRPEAAVRDTHAWLDFFFPRLEERHLLTKGQPKSGACAFADILVDDKPSNIEEWVDAGKRGAVLVRRPWNMAYKPPPEVPRLYDLHHLPTVVEEFA